MIEQKDSLNLGDKDSAIIFSEDGSVDGFLPELNDEDMIDLESSIGKATLVLVLFSTDPEMVALRNNLWNTIIK